MKKMFRNYMLVKIALLCCFVMNLNGGIPLQAAEATHHSSHSSFILSVSPVDHFGIAGQAKLSGGANVSLPVMSKNHVRETTLAIRNIASVYFNNLSQYTFYADNLIRRLEKPDIVYPFHSFW
ncbi:MAG: hypothetical protein Q8861_12650 [Bacteroidota bacterium]|nr:hypothetical protein [Bacteroidota bacterium]